MTSAPFLFPFIEKSLERVVCGYCIHLTFHSSCFPTFALEAPTTLASLGPQNTLNMCLLQCCALHPLPLLLPLAHRLYTAAPPCPSKLSLHVTFSEIPPLAFNQEITCAGFIMSLHLKKYLFLLWPNIDNTKFIILTVFKCAWPWH